MKKQLKQFYISILITCVLSACGGKNAPSTKSYAALPDSKSGAVEKTHIDMVQNSENSISLQSNDPNLDQLELKKYKDGCYQQSQAGDLKDLHICATEAVISMNAIKNGEVVHAVLARTQDANTLVEGLKLEDPKAYNLGELVNRGRKLNFDSRAEFERLQGAKANMRLHYLNLLPHLSFGSILTVATSDPIGWLSAIGDLVPFLLPSRWAQASEASHLYKAQKAGVAILQEDAVQIIEGLVMQVSTDYENLQTVLKIRALTEKSVKQIAALEAEGKMPKGRYRDVASALHLIGDLENSLTQNYSSDLIELAYATGFCNPLAITGVQFKPFMDIENPAVYKFESSLGNRVLQTALELQQMDEMILAARADTNGRMFQWLDPAGDPQVGLGLGLPFYVKVGASNVNTLVSQKAQLSSQLLVKLAHAIDDYNAAVNSYRRALRGIELQQERLNSASEELAQSPNDTPVGELQDIYAQLAGQIMGSSSNKYGAYSSLSRINRLLHQGPYVH